MVAFLVDRMNKVKLGAALDVAEKRTYVVDLFTKYTM